MVGGLREGVAAGRGLGTLLQFGVEGLYDFIFLLQLLTQPACAHRDKTLQLHFELINENQLASNTHKVKFLVEATNLQY